jgi:hypothetical protein
MAISETLQNTLWLPPKYDSLSVLVENCDWIISQIGQQIVERSGFTISCLFVTNTLFHFQNLFSLVSILIQWNSNDLRIIGFHYGITRYCHFFLFSLMKRNDVWKTTEIEDVTFVEDILIRGEISYLNYLCVKVWIQSVAIFTVSWCFH